MLEYLFQCLTLFFVLTRSQESVPTTTTQSSNEISEGNHDKEESDIEDTDAILEQHTDYVAASEDPLDIPIKQLPHTRYRA
jgi:hypothetical protein